MENLVVFHLGGVLGLSNPPLLLEPRSCSYGDGGKKLSGAKLTKSVSRKKQGREKSFGGDQQEERKGKSTWRIASLPRTYVSIISASRAMP